MSPVARLQEARRLVVPPVQVEDELVEEARLLAAWLGAKHKVDRRPSASNAVAADQALSAYRAHVLQRVPRPR